MKLAATLALIGLVAGCRGAPSRHVIEIRGMAFYPAVLEVARGDTVVWINRDIVPHTATLSGRGGWDTGEMSRDQEGKIVAGAAGDVNYVCSLHPVMEGKLIVR